MVEGWDVSTLLSPETKYSSEDYEEFKRTVQFGGNLSSLVIGSPDISNDQQYDIIYVNWDNGMDYIERNALAVQEIIKWVNTIKEGTEKTVLIGQSMGGVVGRYAIRDLEQQGYVHNIRLFVSHDSPQQGANIPLSIQNFYRNMKRIGVRAPAYWLFNAASQLSQFVPAISFDNPLPNMFSILDQPATKQMLINRIDGNYNVDNQTFTNFYAMMDAKGYPSQNNIRNIAISNGSECGSNQNFNEGDFIIKAEGKVYTQLLGDVLGMSLLPYINGGLSVLVSPNFLPATLLSILPGNSRYNTNLQCNALHPTGGNQIYDFSLSYTKKILWLFPVTTYIFNVQKYQPSNLNLHYDNYGGGYVNMKDYAGNINGSASDNWFLFGGYSYSAYMRDKFTLVPTPSALGIKATSNENFERSYVGANPPLAPINSPFHNFTTAFSYPYDNNRNNETHISFSARNGNWLANELSNPNNPYSTDCSYMCSNMQITGDTNICTSATYSAPSGASFYNWSITQGANLVTLSVNGTPNLTLTALPNAMGLAILSLTLGGNGVKCGNITITKKNWLGKPQVDVEQIPTNGFIRGKIKSFNPEVTLEDQGIDKTQIKWRVRVAASRSCGFSTLLITNIDKI